jgi:SAM-dependent MidA family methyltransferase
MQTKETLVSSEAFKLHQNLCAQIDQKINDSNGVISFAQFMQLALYSPRLGYYQNGLQKFGAQGDFITAPEMGELFACGLVNSLVSVSNDFTARLLEIGAGTGQLAADVLTELNLKNRAPERYYILEPSANLQSLQLETIKNQVPEMLSRVEWLNQLPENFEGCIFANEVIDAIPCERIQKNESGWQQIGVKVMQGQFDWLPMQDINPKDLPDLLAGEEYINGYTTEMRPLAKPWIKSLAECLSQGHIFLFDYGYSQKEYYHPQRVEGSLRCFNRHQAHSQPLELTGLQDITAHVDFTEIAKAAVNAGLDVDGFTTQAGFLLENGILQQVSADIDDGLSALNYQMSQQVQKLTSPGQMGEVVKVIGLSKSTHSVPSGFSLQDRLHSL